jgi:hypothetical protein
MEAIKCQSFGVYGVRKVWRQVTCEGSGTGDPRPFVVKESDDWQRQPPNLAEKPT